MTFTAEDKLQEALREVRMRQRVYPGQIDSGYMSEEVAKRRIAIMQEIAADYEKQAVGERLL